MPRSQRSYLFVEVSVSPLNIHREAQGRDHVSLSPLLPHHRPPGTTALFLYFFFLCVLIECLLLLWDASSMKADLRGLLPSSVPSPRKVSSTQQVLRKCLLNKRMNYSISLLISFFMSEQRIKIYPHKKLTMRVKNQGNVMF